MSLRDLTIDRVQPLHLDTRQHARLHIRFCFSWYWRCWRGSCTHCLCEQDCDGPHSGQGERTLAGFIGWRRRHCCTTFPKRGDVLATKSWYSYKGQYVWLQDSSRCNRYPLRFYWVNCGMFAWAVQRGVPVNWMQPLWCHRERQLSQL